jgi:hypothetical protein
MYDWFLICTAGIGFKATAVASEATYIASSGYEFCFDLRPGAYSVPWLGLVCPRWEEGLTQRMQGWAARRAQGGLGGLGSFRAGSRICLLVCRRFQGLAGLAGLVCPRWEWGLTPRMQGWAARRAQGLLCQEKLHA